MSKLPKIRRPNTRISDGELNRMAQSVISSLTDNAYFPEVGDELAIFKEAYYTFYNSIPPRNIRNSVNSAVKNSNKEVAVKAMNRLSLLVAYYANYDMDALESSGFDLANKPQARGLVGLVNNIELHVNGVEGMVIISCKRDENATSYKARVSTDGENWLWVNASPTRTVKVHNVPRGIPLYIQMQLENIRGYSPWSDAVSGMIPTSQLIPTIHD